MRFRNPYTIYRRENDVWYYRVYDKIGNRRSFSTGEKQKGKALQVITELISNGKLIPGEPPRIIEKSCKLTFSAYAAGWWRDGSKYRVEQKLYGHELTERYCDTNTRTVNNWLVPYFGSYRLDKISKHVIEEWQIGLVVGKHLSPKSVENYKGVLSTMLGQAWHDDLIKENPCLKVKHLKGDEKEKGILTLDEAQKLFSSDSFWKGDRMAMLGNLLASCTGMRSREVAALRGEDIHDTYIVVKHSDDVQYGLKKTKTSDIRIIPLPEKVMAILHEYVSEPQDWIFTLDGYVPVKEHYFLRSLRRALKRIGISAEEVAERNLCFHSWRYFLNSLLIGAGISEKKTQKITGHVTQAMTDHYLKLTVDSLKDIVDVTSEILDGRTTT